MELERYDRQLRLWGHEGQTRLSAASVCVIGSSVLATEVLKNLVLPGIGSFCIVDDAQVTKRDISNNFFLEPSDEGEDRAMLVTRKLVELNPCVKGIHAKSLSEIRDKKFDIFFACNSKFQFPAQTLINVTSTGYLGKVQILSSKAHIVLDAKSDEGQIDDLGILYPWAPLRDFVDSFSFDSTTSEVEFFHIPWLVILIKAIDKLRGSGKIISQSTIMDAVNDLEGDRKNGRNFHEAKENIYQVTALTSDVEVINRSRHLSETLEVDEFPDEFSSQTACALRALISFREQEGRFPVFGHRIPDMTSTTAHYNQLVGIFKNQFEADVSKLLEIATGIEEGHLRKIVSNFRNIQIIRFPSLSEESASPLRKRHNSCEENELIDELLEPEQVEVVKVLDGARLDEDGSSLQLEVDRYCNSVELHAVSAVVGSVAAQEAVKLLTKQFVPINNSFVFNGINGSGFIYRSS